MNATAFCCSGDGIVGIEASPSTKGSETMAAVLAWLEDALTVERKQVDRFLRERHLALLAEIRDQVLGQEGNIVTQLVITPADEDNKRSSLAESAPVKSLLSPPQQDASQRASSQEPCGFRRSTGSSSWNGTSAQARASARRSMRKSLLTVESKEQVEAKVNALAKEMDSKPGVSSKRLKTMASIGLQREREPGLRGTLIYYVTSPQFEMAFGTLIILNTIVMAVQRQYEGLDSAATIEFYGTGHSAEDSWPNAQHAFEVLEWFFGIVFTLEVVSKLSVQWCRFFTESFWNWFDSVIVLCWLFDRMSFGAMLMNPMMLRLARLARLVRLLRIVRWVKVFDPLNLMVKAIKSSLTVLMWSLILLCLVICVIAMVCGQLLEEYIRNPRAGTPAQRELVFEYWGSFSRSVVTMFEITLANWAPPCRALMDNVDEWWGVFFLIYKCSIGFAVVQVITSVFIQQTFKVAARDEEVMIAEKQAQSAAYIKNLDNLFSVLDVDGSGYLDQDEFETVLNDSKVRTWFAALEVDVAEVSKLFDLLDDGDGLITRTEFLEAVKGLRGPAKSSDMLQLTRQLKDVQRMVSCLDRGMRKCVEDVYMGVNPESAAGGPQGRFLPVEHTAI